MFMLLIWLLYWMYVVQKSLREKVKSNLGPSSTRSEEPYGAGSRMRL